MTDLMTFDTLRYGDLTEIVCKATSPICPTELHTVATITHTPRGNWIVFTHRLGHRATLATRKAAEAYVREHA